MSAIATAGLGALAAGLSLGDTLANWGISRNLNEQAQDISLYNMAKQYGYDTDLWSLQSNFNRLEAQKNREWQEKMSNSAYQRAIDDMTKAGINPASLGGAQVVGASTPSGGSASASMPSVGSSGASSAHFGSSNMAGVFSHLASSALYGMFANDRQAAKTLASEIQDNAKHAYKMQEINERINGNKAVQELRNSSFERIAKNRNQNYTNNKKADREARHDDIYFKSQRNIYEEAYKRAYGHKSYR